MRWNYRRRKKISFQRWKIYRTKIFFEIQKSLLYQNKKYYDTNTDSNRISNYFFVKKPKNSKRGKNDRKEKSEKLKKRNISCSRKTKPRKKRKKFPKGEKIDAFNQKRKQEINQTKENRKRN